MPFALKRTHKKERTVASQTLMTSQLDNDFCFVAAVISETSQYETVLHMPTINLSITVCVHAVGMTTVVSKSSYGCGRLRR